jgi:Kef-type K+ transport system membrane component KefB
VFLVVTVLALRPLLRRLGTVPVWLAICLALLGAWTTETIGTHAIFGAFIVGTAMPRGAPSERVIHDQVEHVAVTLLLPVFFVVVGLSTRIDLLTSLYLWAVALAVILVAVAGKLGGCMIAARVMGEPWRDAAALGVLMNTRGLTELVILSVGLELGVINATLFTIMVLMALVTTLMATPLLLVIAPTGVPGRVRTTYQAHRDPGLPSDQRAPTVT